MSDTEEPQEILAPIKIKARGTREEVFNGIAKRTSGGMTKNDIMQKGCKFVSIKSSEAAKKNAMNNLPNLKSKAVSVKKEVEKIESKVEEVPAKKSKSKKAAIQVETPAPTPAPTPVIERVTRSRSKKATN